jgi:hypothetical protein
MTAPYNVSRIANSTSFGEFASNINTASGGFLGIAILASYFIIALATLITNGYTFKESYAASTFTTSIMTILFWLLEWVGETILFFFLALTLVGFAMLYTNPLR